MMVFSDEPATDVATWADPELAAELTADPTLASAPPPHGPTEQAAEWFRIAFEYAPMGAAIMELGPAGQRWFVLVNPALAAMFGCTVAELIGRDLIDFSEPDYAEEDLLVVRELVSGSRRTYVRNKRYRRADGRALRTELRVSRMELPGHPGVTTLAHFIDVTTRYETEEYRARVATMKTAVTSLVTKVLTGAPVTEIYSLVVDRVARLFDAEHVSLVVVDPESGVARIVAGVGPVSDQLLSGAMPVPQEMTHRLIRLGAHVMSELDRGFGDWARSMIGPAATARFGPEQGAGLIAIGRRPGARPFEPSDVELLLTLAQQVALAVELGQARADQERLAVLEDRHRIARDLHDTVIQDLIAIGMQIDAGVANEPDRARCERDSAIVDQLEEAVRRLRGSVFDLRTTPRDRSLGEGVRVTATEATRVLGHRPTVHLEGYLEAVPAALSFTILAVLREALSNVARHARASTTSVHLNVDDEQVRLVIDDDGSGLPERLTTGDGLSNIRDRATVLGGSATVTNRVPRGTRLTWSCPLPAE